MVIRADAETGEGPVWDYRTGELVWVDIPRGILHRSKVRPPTAGMPTVGPAPAGGETADGETAGGETGSSARGRVTDRAVAVGMMLGAAVPDAAAGWAAAAEDGFGLIDADGQLVLLDRMLPEPGTRMNDGACDSHGRMWAGSLTKTFDPGQGKLHCWAHGQPSRVVAEGLTLPNGIGWDAADKWMYLADTRHAAVFAYEFDLDDARLGERQALIEVPAAPVSPTACASTRTGAYGSRNGVAGGYAGTIRPAGCCGPSSFPLHSRAVARSAPARRSMSPPHVRACRRASGQPLAGSVFAFDAVVAARRSGRSACDRRRSHSDAGHGTVTCGNKAGQTGGRP